MARGTLGLLLDEAPCLPKRFLLSPSLRPFAATTKLTREAMYVDTSMCGPHTAAADIPDLVFLLFC
jgi:hypothetical protein